MPKKYHQYHLDIIQNLTETLRDHPALGKYQGENHLGYIYRIQQGLEMVTDDIKQGTYATVDSASGMRLHFVDFETDDPELDALTSIPHALDNCQGSVAEVLEDRSLMQQEPALEAYLRYANLQLERAALEGQDALSHYGDPATNIAASIFVVLDHPPNRDRMAQIRQEDPEAYAAGEAMIRYLNAYVDYYTPDPPLQPGVKQDPEALRRDKLRKMENLQRAAGDIAQYGDENAERFLQMTGNARLVNNYKSAAFMADPQRKPEDTDEKYQERLLLGRGAKSVETQLAVQRALMEKGVSPEDSRLMIEFAYQINSVVSDAKSRGRKVSDMDDPFRSQMQKLVDLAEECPKKLVSGFASTEEKNEFFKNIADSVEEYRASVSATEFGKKVIEGKKQELDVRGAMEDFTFHMVPWLKQEGNVFNRVGYREIREAVKGQLETFLKRSELSPSLSVLLNAGTGGLGPKDQKEYQDYTELRKAAKTYSRLLSEFDWTSKERERMAEGLLALGRKSEAYLKDVLDDPERVQNPKYLDATRERVTGALEVLQRTYPEKAEIMRRKAADLLGVELSSEQVQQETIEIRDRKPNYGRYYQLHTGEAASNIPEKKLPEYAAKAAVSMMLSNKPHQKFNLDEVRGTAQKLLKSPNFAAAVKAAGPEKLREILTSGESVRLVKLVGGGAERYALTDKAKEKLNALSAGMNTRKRSKEWVALKVALQDDKMRDSSKVFDTVEGYLKGKKSVSSDPQRQESVKLALDALAIAAKDGDATAKARAQMLVDRFNEVRGVKPGHKNYIDLKNYGTLELAPEEPQNQVSL